MARKSAASKRVEIDPAMLQKIRDDIADWWPGKWAERVASGPACQCGLSRHYIEANAPYTTHGKPLYICQRHPESGEAQ